MRLQAEKDAALSSLNSMVSITFLLPVDVECFCFHLVDSKELLRPRNISRKPANPNR